jgi:hypothetical protein
MPLEEAEVLALQWGISCLSMKSPPATSQIRIQGTVDSKSVWVTVFSPHVFAEIRESASIGLDDFIKSLTAELTGGRRASIAKSGSLFYKSVCNRFLLKTVHAEEIHAMQAMAESYAKHFRVYPNSLLTRVLAAYRTRVRYPGKLRSVVRYFVVQLNVFPPQCIDNLKAIYDLKGTSENRLVKPDIFEKTRVGKDENLKENIIFDSPMTKESVMSRIETDVQFLRSFNILDYSLLLGIYQTSNNVEASCLRGNGDIAYIIGLVDILQPWSRKKRVAHLFKSTLKVFGKEIDTEPPDYYSRRLLEYCRSKIGSSESAA